MSPATTVFTLFGFIVFVLAYIIRIFELPFYINEVEDLEGLDKFFNAVWFIIVTITTVGYGDIYPHTVYGKIVAIFAALQGALLISLFVLASSKLVDLTEHQEKALKHINMSRSAAQTIQKAIKFYLSKKKFYKWKLQVNPQQAEQSLFMSMIVDLEEIRQHNHINMTMLDDESVSENLIDDSLFDTSIR